jgi:hypothetical protein
VIVNLKEIALTLKSAMEQYEVDEFIVIATADGVTFRLGKVDKMTSRKYKYDRMDKGVEEDLKSAAKGLRRDWI